jgi:hypothetical protein
MFTHNSRKPLSAYHIATPYGTACKLENSKFYRYQDTVIDTPRRASGSATCART